MNGGLDKNLYFHEEAGIAEKLLAGQRKKSKTKLNDVNSIASDPMFTDHIRGDFSFKDGSPALKLGIKPISLDIVSKGLIEDPFLKRFTDGMPMHFEHVIKNRKKKGKKNPELDL